MRRRRMLTASDLAAAFERNRWVIREQSDGLTHADSVLQPPFRANCLNWVIGHVVAHRDKVLATLGTDPVLTPERAERYGKESNPILEQGEDVVELAALLDLLDETQQRLNDSLRSVTTEDLHAPVSTGTRTVALAERLHFLYFHDTYHTGQTELLRQLTGVDDKVI
jgi:hypothetical protein